MPEMFEVKSGKIVAIDPCYDDMMGLGEVFENVKNGDWIGMFDISDEGSWGNRVSSIKAYHKSNTGSSTKSAMKLVGSGGTVPVDSGQAGIFDAQYFKDHIHEREFASNDFYGQCCEMTLSDEMGGVIGNSGIVSSSGYGDGCYNAYAAYDKNGCVVAIEIRFIGDEDEEYDEDEE